MDALKIHGAPSEYLQEIGALDQLEEKLLERGFRHVLIVHGEKSWRAAAPFWPTFSTVTSETYRYHGECSISEIEALTQYANEKAVDAIIGVGGGKVLDLVKAASHNLHQRPVLIPTLASNCSPWASLSVIYDDQGAFVNYTIFPESASLVLIEPRILVTAPVELLIAGIGDTLAKWYEADVQLGDMENKPVPLELSYFAAKQCKEVLLKHSEGAIEAAKTGVVNDDFVKVAETIIMTGGLVGGFGDRYGRIAGAHAVHNGLTVLDETHDALHGDKVAYGILIQLVLEDKWDEIEKLIPYYQKIGLPASLQKIGVNEPTEEDIQRVAEKTVLPEESIHVLPGEITAERVREAMLVLEERAALV